MKLNYPYSDGGRLLELVNGAALLEGPLLVPAAVEPQAQ